MPGSVTLAVATLLLAVASVLVAPATAWAASPHLATTGSDTCSACHSTHQATTFTGLFRGYGASSGELPVCYSCHDGTGSSTNIKSGADSFGLTSGHVLESLADTSTPSDLTNACSSCHTAHGDYTLRPDLPSRQVNSVPIASKGIAWCLACHNDTQDWYAKNGTYPSLSSPTKDASGYPVAGTFAGASVYTNQTKNKHALIPASGGAKPRQAGDCLYCHAAHGSTARYDALLGTLSPSTSQTVAADRTQGTYAALCFTCHANIKRYATAGASDVGIGSSGGHRVKSSGGALPVDAPLPCYDCHNPHGSSRGNGRLISDALGASLDTSGGPEAVRRFCFTCHTTSDGFGWESVSATYTTPAATSTVEGLKRDGGAAGSGPDGGQNWLRLRAISGHSKADASMSCYVCHGSDDSNNVHNPASPSHTSTGGSDFVSAGMNNSDHGIGQGEYASCSDCHSTELTPLHANYCGACHSSSAPDAVKTAVANHDTACTACHPSQHTTENGAHEDLYKDGCACHDDSSNWDDPTQTCTECHWASAPVLKPTTTSDAKPAYINGATIKLFPSDNVYGTFGIKATYYILDGAAAVVGSQIGIPAPLSGTQTHTVQFWSTDWSGNTEAAKTATCTVSADVLPPTTTSNVVAGKTYAGDQTFTLTTTDLYSYVAGTWWQLDGTGGTWTSGTSIVLAAPPSGTISHTLYWYSRDGVGNTETIHSAPFSILSGRDYSFTGANQTFVVPNGVTTMSVTLFGGSGGGCSSYSVGGYGGKVTAVIPVTPGQTLTVRVGGAGGYCGIWGSGGIRGWPTGGYGGNNTGTGGYGGGGGGSSSILLGAAVQVEAGGGGGGGGRSGGNGGAGGSQGAGLGGNQTGTNGGYAGGGGGGGWNRGTGGGYGVGGTGGTSYIAVGGGALTSGVQSGDGSVTIRYSAGS